MVDKDRTKEYVAEYVIDSKESLRRITIDDAEPYFKFILKYLNEKQDTIKLETLLEKKDLEGQIHLFIKVKSHITDINDLFEYFNNQCSLAFVEVMTRDNEKIWGDIIRLYQYNYFNKISEEKKLNDAEIADNDGWIPLEELKEAIIKNHIVVHKDHLPKDIDWSKFENRTDNQDSNIGNEEKNESDDNST